MGAWKTLRSTHQVNSKTSIWEREAGYLLERLLDCSWCDFSNCSIEALLQTWGYSMARQVHKPAFFECRDNFRWNPFSFYRCRFTKPRKVDNRDRKWAVWHRAKKSMFQQYRAYEHVEPVGQHHTCTCNQSECLDWRPNNWEESTWEMIASPVIMGQHDVHALGVVELSDDYRFNKNKVMVYARHGYIAIKFVHQKRTPWSNILPRWPPRPRKQPLGISPPDSTYTPVP